MSLSLQRSCSVSSLTDRIKVFSLKTALQRAGGSSERYDGILYIIAYRDRRMRIEVGSELEGYIHNQLAIDILISADYDVNRISRGPALSWTGITSSIDGSKLIAVAYNG